MMAPRRSLVGRGLDYALGFGFALLAILVHSAPAHVFGLTVPLPWLAFAPVFMWAARRPTVAACGLSFTIGLLQDALSGGPLGPWAAGFLVGYAFAASQREALHNQSAFAVWIVYGLACVSVALAAALVASLAVAGAPSFGVLAMQTVVTMALGPLAATALGGWSKLTAEQRVWL